MSEEQKDLVKELVQQILEQSEWARYTINEKLTFGLTEAQAVYRRESRAKGVLLTTINSCKEILSKL